MGSCLRIDSPELPYPLPENIINAAGRDLTNLNRDTDPEAVERLQLLLADYTGVKPEEIVVGPGSDLLLREIVLRSAGRRQVVMVDPTFLTVLDIARRYANDLVSIRVEPPAFSLNRNGLLQVLTKPSLVIIDNPNNPTGRLLLDRELVESILEVPQTLLVVEEAYFEFSGLSFAGMVADHDNLVLVRTLDKAFSLAGARIGYLIAGRTFLDSFSLSFDVLAQPSLQAATEALLHPSYMWKNVQRIMQERERLSAELEILGAEVFVGSTNFLLLRSKIRRVADELRDRGIPVLNLSTQLGPGFVRIAVGEPESNDALIQAYRSIEKGKP